MKNVIAFAAVLLIGCNPYVGPKAEPDSGKAPQTIQIEDAAVIHADSGSEAGVSTERGIQIDALATYLAASMQSWRSSKDELFYTSLAYDIASVAERENEAPVLKTRAKTAVLIAAVGFFESGFVKYVWDGRCNDAAWRVTKEGRGAMLSGGDCDGGYAYSGFQIHPDEGIVLDGPLWQRAGNFDWEWRRGNEAQIIKGRDLVANRQLAITVGLHMIRRAMLGGSLAGYTGEDSTHVWSHPKADARLRFAQAWNANHPFNAFCQIIY